MGGGVRHRTARLLAARLARGGFEVRRHPASRRQKLLQARGVDVVLDVGAATGAYAGELREFGYRGRIVSFEPMSAPFAELVARAAVDESWDARQIGLGDTAGEATINIASNSTSSSLLPMLDAHREAAPWVDYVGTETITVARLDDVIDQVAPGAERPFLKIDTQGFERAVLSGAPETVARCVGLQLELSFVPLYEGGPLVDEMISWAYQSGFTLAVVEQGYAAPTGEILQMDGIFLRPETH
ncbi:FkbM family methyltransferase [Nocardioides limicola]|uniref:FkbM family methyltransferase n=1 Tax=Nocardioides limicola TaxID=2803368 RepID=UPI00193BAA4E|nr:FkbM family methyltransferase [Nocardioides sp. DJM-14]